MPKRLVVISDLHAGSKFGPAPENWKTNDGATAGLLKSQFWLYDKYLEYVDEFKKPDILLVNGDATDGTQHLNYGRECWTTDPFEQYRLAEHLIKLWQPKEIYATPGSRYHVEFQGVMIEKFLAQKVKAKRYGWHINADIEGKRCNFSHEVPVSMSSWQYRTTPLAVQLVLDRLQNAERSANLVVRSHAHYFCFVGFSDQLAMITPGFQGQTPYTARKFPTMLPKIGVVSIDLPSLDFEYRTANGPLLAEESLDA